MSEETRYEAVDKLWDDDVDGLMQRLGARAKAQEEGWAEEPLHDWDPPEDEFAADEEAGPEWTAMIQSFGETWWEKLEPKIYDLLCKPGKEHDELIDSLKEGAKMLAVMLAPALVAQAAALPAIAIVIATIAAKKITDSGLEALCEKWSESLAEEAEKKTE
jgi:hypothetical protein